MSSLKSIVVVLAVCFASVYDVDAIKIPTAYDRRLDVFRSVMMKDDSWKFVFKQNVYFENQGHYHQTIVEELLEGARVDETTTSEASASEAPAAEAAQPEEAAAAPSRIPIKPHAFLKNLMFKNNRYRIGSVLKLGLKVLQSAFSCLTYKHAVHLLKVIRVEMSRKADQRKASSWSGKALGSLATIIMKMAELGYMDGKLLRAAKFMYLYQNSSTKRSTSKFNYTSTIETMSADMQKFIQDNCVKAPKTEQQIAEELNVFHTSSLYKAGEARDLGDNSFKTMFLSIKNKIKLQVGGIPYTNGVSVRTWDSFLHFLSDDYGHEDETFIQINR